MNSRKSNEYVNGSWVILLNMYGLAYKCITTLWRASQEERCPLHPACGAAQK